MGSVLLRALRGLLWKQPSGRSQRQTGGRPRRHPPDTDPTGRPHDKSLTKETRYESLTNATRDGNQTPDLQEAQRDTNLPGRKGLNLPREQRNKEQPEELRNEDLTKRLRHKRKPSGNLDREPRSRSLLGKQNFLEENLPEERSGQGTQQGKGTQRKPAATENMEQAAG